MLRGQLRWAVMMVAFGLAACGPDQTGPAVTESSKEAGPVDCQLTMGWDPWPPYHYRDVGGDVHGLDVELLTAIAERAGCELVFTQGNWRDLLSMLRGGDVDLLTGATRTPAREEFALFSDPYRDETFVLYVRDGELDDHAGKDLAGLLAGGFRVGITDEYVYGNEVTTLRENPDYDSLFIADAVGEANFIKLIDYEIDGLLEDPVVAVDVIRRKGLEEQVSAHPIKVARGQVHVMMSRESVSPETLTKLNQGLASIRDDGTYEQIIGRYLD